MIGARYPPGVRREGSSEVEERCCEVGLTVQGTLLILLAKWDIGMRSVSRARKIDMGKWGVM